MADRTITDTGGRVWSCASPARSAEADVASTGRDVVITCSTPSVAKPLDVTVGWQWEKMAENGLARVISAASPVPRSAN